MRADDLAAAAAELLAADEPVSFYDVVTLLRRFGADDPPESALTRLLALHEAPHLTDGAREQLAAFLTATAARHATERELAATDLGPKSSGRTVRAAAGSVLRLRLDDRPKQGLRWEIAAVTGPLRCARRDSVRAHDTQAEFAIALDAPGRGRLTLEESGGAKGRVKPRDYVLYVTVEVRAESAPPAPAPPRR